MIIKLLKRIGSFILNLFEIYIPIISFSILFILFIIQIFSRYILKSPLSWPYEITVMMFLWTIMFGASYVMRLNKHVSFTVIYDKFSTKGKKISNILTNILIVALFSMAIYPSFQYIIYIGYRKTSVFKIPLSYVFGCFIFFMFSVIVHSINNIYIDIKQLRKENLKEEEKDIKINSNIS